MLVTAGPVELAVIACVPFELPVTAYTVVLLVKPTLPVAVTVGLILRVLAGTVL